MTKGILETRKTKKNLNIDVTDHENECIENTTKHPTKGVADSMFCCIYIQIVVYFLVIF
jgi:hypothetical protein